MNESADSTATMALVAFLRAEADAAEEKAKSYRRQAEQLAQTFGVSSDMQQRYGTSDTTWLVQI